MKRFLLTVLLAGVAAIGLDRAAFGQAQPVLTDSTGLLLSPAAFLTKNKILATSNAPIAGEYAYYDGTVIKWSPPPTGTLPDPSGNPGVMFSNGTAASWAESFSLTGTIGLLGAAAPTKGALDTGGTITASSGTAFGIRMNSTIASAVNGDVLQALTVQPTWSLATGVAATAVYGINVNPTFTGSGTVTTAYGLNINSITAGSTNYAIKTGSGLVNFGDYTGALKTLGVGGQANVSSALLIYGQSGAVTTGTNQVGLNSQPLFGTDSTGSGEAVTAIVQTTNGGSPWTMTAARGIHILNAIKGGANSTITTQEGLRIDNMTAGTANHAIVTGTGDVSFGDTTASTSTTTGAVRISGGLGVAGQGNFGGTLNTGISGSSQGQLNILSGASVSTYHSWQLGADATAPGFFIYDATRGAYVLEANASTGAITLAGALGIGGSPSSNATATVTGSVNTSSGAGYAFRNIGTVTSTANSDQLVGISNTPTFSTGTFTSLTALGNYVSMTKTGTGTISTAVALSIDNVTIGTTNYAIKTGTGLVSLGDRLTLTATTSLPGLNVGTYAGDPVTLANGDMWYNTSSGQLSAEIGGSVVRIGSPDSLLGLASTGLIKRTGPNAYAIATSGTDYAPAVGDATIATVGTITAGIWTGTTIAVANGGTGATTAAAAVKNLTPGALPLTESSNAVTIDWSSGTSFYFTLNGNLNTVTFSNTYDNASIVVYVTNTASNYTVTWGNSINWVAGSQPVQTTGAHTDKWFIQKINGTYYGSVEQNH